MSGPTAGSGGPLDLLAAGRACVDLYAEQEGARLEDADSFAKYVGGSALNIAVGVARQGLSVGMLTGVGDEAMGRFVRSTLEAEGVDVSGVTTVPGHLTSLVLLAIRESEGFPRIFFAHDGADLSIGPDDVDAELVARAKAVLIGGTYLARPSLASATEQIVAHAKAAGARVVLDVDYRPVLWGVVGPGQGTLDRAPCPEATQALQALLPGCDLVVGTEAELCLAGGEDELVPALRRIRALSDAVIVAKRGAAGSVVLDGEIPPDLDAGGIRAPGFAVEVVNSAGAGDGFLAGFLSGWLRGADLAECARRANALGAMVVARHGCAPAMPTKEEVEYFLGRDGRIRRPAADKQLAQLHRLAGRKATPERLYVLAFDHRWQLEEAAERSGVGRERISELKNLIWQAWGDVAAERPEAGVLVDDRYGSRVLELASGSGRFVARALDEPATRPLRVLGEPEVAAYLRTWPRDHVAKVIAYMAARDPVELAEDQVATLVRVQQACWRAGRELLVEIQAPPGEPHEPGELAELVRRLLAAGVEPEWWKLPPTPRAEDWAGVAAAVQAADLACRGLLVLGQGSSPEELEAAFAAAAGQKLCRGFAVGRTIFGEPAEAWLAGEASDDELRKTVAERFVDTIARFERATGRASVRSA